MFLLNESKKKIMRFSREEKLDHFYSLFKEGELVLDVGVSSKMDNTLPYQNYFLTKYRYKPETYTGLGIQDMTGLFNLFPGKRFVQYPGGKFPFADKEFSWVFSNAVIEHVGDDDAKVLFLNEMMRVAHNVFFTTPNKYFPIESHTNLLFLHWNDTLFYRWLKKHRPWMRKDSLRLLSLQHLRKLMQKSNAVSFSLHKNRVFGIPMTFTVICTDQQSALAENFVCRTMLAEN
jgi:hypothetical protein